MSQTPNRAARRAAKKNTTTSPNLTTMNATKPLQDFSIPLDSLKPGMPNLSSELPLSNPSLENITPSSNMSQFPNLPPLNLNQNLDTGISSELESSEEKPKKQDRFSKMHDDLLEQFGGLGTMVYAMHEKDGLVLLQRADPLATKLTNVARQNPAVYKAIKKYLEGSVYTVLALEVAMIANAIADNHGLNPIEKITGSVAGLFKRGNDGQADVSRVPAALSA